MHEVAQRLSERRRLALKWLNQRGKKIGSLRKSYPNPALNSSALGEKVGFRYPFGTLETRRELDLKCVPATDSGIVTGYAPVSYGLQWLACYGQCFFPVTQS